MAVELTGKIVPKGDAFVPIVNAKAVDGVSGGGGVIPDDAISESSVTQHIAAGGSVVSVDSLTELRAEEPADENNTTFAFLSGYAAIGDGGDGFFYWDPSSTATDNDGTIIKVTTITTGRWLRDHKYGVLHSAWFGHNTSNSYTLNDTIMTSVMDAMPANGGIVQLGEGTFFHLLIEVGEGVIFQGLGVTTIIKVPTRAMLPSAKEIGRAS